MTFDELQREAEKLSPEERRKLLRVLADMELRGDERQRQQHTRRLDDRNPGNGPSLDDAKRRLKRSSV